MAAKLSEFYEQAKALGGVQAVMKLAMITKISSQAAASSPDTPEKVKAFTEAFAKLRQQLGK